ncbi:MAG TPA: queuosine precursor transporter [Firmicutes bacterium]|nr:queuosine precursor transporter [Bacillota bacterium]
MPNELILLINLLVVFGGVLLAYYLFGTRGLTCFTVFATIAANIEVLILIDAFGLEQTLGNIVFAATFLITDIISEVEGKEQAKQTVHIGIFTTVCFLALTQIWLLYTPSPNDWVFPHIQQVFTISGRVMVVSLLVYAFVQRLDVWLYHKWWDFTKKKYGDAHRFLWLRNNGSTLISQFLNSILFNFGAFWGIYDLGTLFSITLTTYLIYIATTLADTPFIYLARKIQPRYRPTN